MSSRNAKHTHYVSNSNNCIYPAMDMPDGYEDEHPEEWRPATASEVDKYKNGESAVELKELPLAPVSVAPVTPTTLTLQPESGTETNAPDMGLPPPPPAPVPAFSIPE